LKILDRRIALSGPDRKRGHQGLLGGGRNIGAGHARRLNRVLDQAVDRRRWNRAGENVIKGRADGINVGPRSLVSSAAVLLLRCVANLQNDRQPLTSIAQGLTRRAEVEQLNLSSGG
jgi:hypothetical protein